MSFPRYPKYKDSGVEWLGQVPEHWEVRSVGRQLKAPPCYGVLVPDFADDGVPMLRISDMQGGTANRESLTRISHELSDEFSRTVVASGDIVISVVGTLGKAFRIDVSPRPTTLPRVT